MNSNEAQYTCDIGHAIKRNKCLKSECKHLRKNGQFLFGKRKGDMR